MMKNKKLFYGILIVVILVIVASGVLYWQSQREEIKTPAITVLSPNGGEVWEIGKTYPISWKGTGFSDYSTHRIALFLWKGNQEVTLISDPSWILPISGSYNWSIREILQLQPGNDYKVEAADIIFNGLNATKLTSGFSGAFSIVAAVT